MDQQPQGNLRTYFEPLIEFRIHSSVLLFSLHTMSLNIDMKMILLCVCCALLCRVRCALCYPSPQQRTMSSVPFYPTADECSESLKTRRDQDARLRRRLPEGEPRCNESRTPLSVLEFRTVQRVLTGRLQPRPATDRVMLPSSVRTTPTAVGRLSNG